MSAPCARYGREPAKHEPKVHERVLILSTWRALHRRTAVIIGPAFTGARANVIGPDAGKLDGYLVRIDGAVMSRQGLVHAGSEVIVHADEIRPCTERMLARRRKRRVPRVWTQLELPLTGGAT